VRENKKERGKENKKERGKEIEKHGQEGERVNRKDKRIWALATGKKARLVAVRVLTRQVGHQEPAVGAAHQEHLHKQRSRRKVTSLQVKRGR
jgi:hypothetical protein